MKKLTESQKEQLKKHAEHHTHKHILMMKKMMEAGSSFTQAHKKAQKSKGN